ncbi:hypothetical protein G5B30_16600 [Sphingobacterium sp. SGG-5]|nr:hypothetical protein [Sphingobacterium sp. SGG-5]NGM63531.1 hypothetical protein [Sphingobacterium sp. SGG-5]
MSEVKIPNKNYSVGQKISGYISNVLIPIELIVLRIEGDKAICKIDYII